MRTRPSLEITAVALSPERHRADLKRLSTQHFDVLVIGGGIVGAGIALDAASRGLRVAVVEALDWASGSSSRSSKLIHGGLRYLEQREFGLVREALRERATLMRTAPHLVTPVSFLLPLQNGLLERTYVATGLMIYDALARAGGRGQHLPLHRYLTQRRASELVPALDPLAFTGAIRYWDAQVDDARHSLSVLRTAATYGAVVTSRARATALLRDGDKVCGAEIVTEESGETHQVHAAMVISATGVWTERFSTSMGVADSLRIAPSKGVHLVVPRSAIDSESALIIRTPTSVLFVLPWGEHWIVGTTDTEWSLNIDYPATTATDIDYLLSTLNAMLAQPLSRSDVEAVYVGLRPLIAVAKTHTTDIPREHAIATPEPGLVLIAGGKYTTYRVMAKDAVDAALTQIGIRAPKSQTGSITLVGGDNYRAMIAREHQFATETGLEVGTIRRLLHRYGSSVSELFAFAATKPGSLRPLASADRYLRAEVDYAVTHEDARHLDDVLVRRTRLSIELRDRGVGAASEVAEIMAAHLNWSARQADEEVEAYRALIRAQLTAENESSDTDAEETLRANL